MYLGSQISKRVTPWCIYISYNHFPSGIDDTCAYDGIITLLIILYKTPPQSYIILSTYVVSVTPFMSG